MSAIVPWGIAAVAASTLVPTGLGAVWPSRQPSWAIGGMMEARAEARTPHARPWAPVWELADVTTGTGPMFLGQSAGGGYGGAPRSRVEGRIALSPPAAERVRIPAGRFVMGSSEADVVRAIKLCGREIVRERCSRFIEDFRAQKEPHEVALSSYALDRTEVTVGHYARCVAAGSCGPPAFSPGDTRFDRPELPVTFVGWEDAGAYCAWAGGRLPTEAEWEYAARGPSGRDYPWGNVYNPNLCNHGALAQDNTDGTDGALQLAPVGSYPDGATPLGLLDMAGNASEWVHDAFELVDEKGSGYAAKPQVNPKGPPTGGAHLIRGGSYLQGAAWMRAAWRGVPYMARAADVGFRCAYDVL